MKTFYVRHLAWATSALLATTFFTAGLAQHVRKMTLAPHESVKGDAPAPILWEAPPVPESVKIESAEERRLKIATVADGLEQPWSMAFLPDGAILVTERRGRLRIIRNGKLDPTPVAGLPAIQTGGPRGLQGLMDIVLHPDFQSNKWIYFVYHKPAGSGAGETVLSRATWNGSLTDVKEIFLSGATETEASRIAFGPDGMLYLTISAPGSPGIKRSQDMNDYAGKIVRLRADGSIPDGNPYAGRSGVKPGIFTLGHRNGHGLAVNPETGELWQTEQGPNGGDEINVLRAGGNYGWPVVSYGRDYWGGLVSTRPFQQGMQDPTIVWLPSIGITGMTFYTGERFPHWRRNLFVTGLRQGGIPRTGQVQRIVFNEKWEELRREPMLTELEQRMRDVRQGPDGLLYVLTAEDDGVLLRIEPR